MADKYLKCLVRAALNFRNFDSQKSVYFKQIAILTRVNFLKNVNLFDMLELRSEPRPKLTR